MDDEYRKFVATFCVQFDVSYDEYARLDADGLVNFFVDAGNEKYGKTVPHKPELPVIE